MAVRVVSFMAQALMLNVCHAWIIALLLLDCRLSLVRGFA